jgi:dephospho-CoA kinase
MQRIGLTGGIGSGKSTVAATLVRCGATLVDTDAIARSLTQPGGAAMGDIVEAFGPGVLAADGSLDRVQMRTRAFGDAGVRTRLESILHPLIGVECFRQATVATGTVVLFDVPLLVESGRWRSLVERVLVIDTPEHVQVQRVMARSCWSREAVLAVIANQAPRAIRLRAADFVIYNDAKTHAELAAEAECLSSRWAKAATR